MPSIFLSLSVYSDPLVFYNSDKETFKVQLEKIAQSNFALAAEVKDSNFTGGNCVSSLRKKMENIPF